MRRVATLFGCSAPAVVLVASLFNGQQVMIDDPVGITAWLLGAAPALLVGLILLPWAAGRRPLVDGSRWVIAATVAMFAWCAIRTIGVPRCLLTRAGEPFEKCLPEWVAWVPLLQAVTTAGLAWLLVAAVPPRLLNRWLVALASAVAVGTTVALVRALIHPRGFNRLGSGLGGPAVLSVALVLAAALLVAAARVTRRRRWPLLLGAVWLAVLVVLTFSRAGVAVAVIVAVCVALVGGLRPNGRGLLLAGGAVAAAVVVVAGAFPELVGRLLTLGDPDRAATTRIALGFWAEDWGRILGGAGTARVWPWFAVDADLLWASENGLYGMAGMSGEILGHAHSTFLTVLVEHGVIGTLLLAAVLAAICWAAVRSRGDEPWRWGLVAAVAVVPAFFFDTYLFRNPGVTFVWWLVIFVGLAGWGVTGRAADGKVDPMSEPGTNTLEA